MTKHSISTLVSTLNAKIAATGAMVTVETATFDRTWGDLEGISIRGEATERAVAYAKAYFQKHIAPRRCYDAQYSWQDRGERNGAREISLVYWPCAD